MLIQGDMNPPCTWGPQRTRYFPHQGFACSWRCQQAALSEASEFVSLFYWAAMEAFLTLCMEVGAIFIPAHSTVEWSLSTIHQKSSPARRQDPLSISHRSTTIKNSHSQRHGRNQMLHTVTVSQCWLLAMGIHVGMCCVRLWVMKRHLPIAGRYWTITYHSLFLFIFKNLIALFC